MNKIKLLTLMLSVVSTLLFSQKNNLINTWNYLRSQELDKAKTAIDAAAQHEDTKNSPKMYLYRAQTYMAIMETKNEKYKALDPEAAEKAFAAVVACLKTDKDKIYYDDVKGLLMPAASRLFNKSLDAFNNKEFDKAIQYTTLLFEGLPFDKDDAMKHQNMTTDKLNYQLFSIAYTANNMTLAKEYLQKLIDAKYKDPTIYLTMAHIYETEKNSEKQLSYIEQGRNLFDDNANLIAAELDYYLALGKIDVLLEKIDKAIEVSPDNEILYFIKGTIYQGKETKDREKKDVAQAEKDFASAETAYKKALELKPDYSDANYNLGAMYVNTGADLSGEADKVPPSNTKKYNEINEKATAEFKKALPYLEKAYQANGQDMKVAQNLKALYQKLGDNEKYKKIKEEIEKMKSAKKDGTK